MHLSQIIKQVNEKNVLDEKLPLLGLNCNKEFMPSIANTIGTDLSKYKLIKKGQFACSLIQVARDELVPICKLDEYDKAIMSSAYFIFEVINKEVHSDYLMCFFRTKRFDDNAMFYSSGGIRGALSWERFLDIDVPVIPYEEQLKLVNQYNAIQERIATKEAINNNLSDEIDLIFREKIIRSSADITLLTEFLTFERGIEPGSSSYETEKSVDNIQFFRVQDILNVESKIFINKSITKNKIAKISDILVSFDGSVGKIGFGINGAYSSGMQKISSKFNEFSSAIIYAIFHSNDIQMELGKSTGTTIAHASKFINILSLPFDLVLYKDVQILIEPFFNQMLTNKLEINNLKNIQSLILEKISLTEQ